MLRRLAETHASPTLSKSTRTEQRALEVPGLGEVPFTWIGQIGCVKIRRLIEEDKLRPVVIQFQRDLKACSSTCLKTLTKLGDSTDPEIQTALQLCRQYADLKKTGPRNQKASRIRKLWVDEGNVCDSSPLLQVEDKATKVLGEGLMGVITQKKKKNSLQM